MTTLDARIASQYAGLTGKLQDAADYVIAHPVEVATRSLRSISSSSGVSPATFSRLSRALGFDTYEDMRELSRAAVGSKMLSFAEKAQRLTEDDGASHMLDRQSGACTANIAHMTRDIDTTQLDAAVTALAGARQVVLYGALGSTGVVEYMAYLARYFAPNWSLAGRMGASIASDLSTLGAGDALLVVTKAPYVHRAVAAAQMAQEAGATTIILTDHHACPGLGFADHGFVVPSDSPLFFSSYAATLVLIETIVAMIVARSDSDITTRIRDVEDRNARLGEFWEAR